MDGVRLPGFVLLAYLVLAGALVGVVDGAQAATPTKTILSYSTHAGGGPTNGDGSMDPVNFTIPDWHDWTVVDGETVFEITASYTINGASATDEISFTFTVDNGTSGQDALAACDWNLRRGNQELGTQSDQTQASFHINCELSNLSPANQDGYRLEPGTYSWGVDTFGTDIVGTGFVTVWVHQTDVVAYGLEQKVDDANSKLDTIKSDVLSDMESNITALIADVDQDLADLRSWSESTWDAWNVTFDGYNSTIRTLVQDEQNATESFIQIKYADRTTYLDGMNATLRDLIVNENRAARDVILGRLADTWSAWNVTFDGYNSSIRTLVQDEQNATEAHVDARYGDRTAYLNGLNETLRQLVLDEHVVTRDEVAAFRAHYDSRQDQWEVSFGSFNQSIRSLVQDEQNETVVYLDGVENTIITHVSSQHTATQADMETWYDKETDYIRAATHAVTKFVETIVGTYAGDNESYGPHLIGGEVGLWQFDADDVSGAVTQDRSGNDLHLTLPGSPNHVAGRFGEAYRAEIGQDRRMTVSDSRLSLEGDMALLFWMAGNELEDGEVLVSSGSSGSYTSPDAASFIIKIRDSASFGKVLQYEGTRDGLSQISLTAEYSIPEDDQKRLYGFVRKGGSIQFVENGTFGDEDTFSKFDPVTGESATFTVLGSTGSGGSFADGVTIDEVRVYDRPLTEEEVLWIAKTPYAGTVTDTVIDDVVERVSTEHGTTRGAISSFRSHYDTRQDDWEVSFDGFNQTIRTLVMDEQNSTANLIEVKYGDRSEYLDGMNSTLRGFIDAEHDATHVAITNARDSTQTLINGKWGQWDVRFDGFNSTIRSLVMDQQNDTEAFVQTKYADRTDFLDGMNATLRTLIQSEHVATRGEVSSFRSHYDSRQDDWEVQFDGFNMTIRSLIMGEQNATESFIQLKYGDRTAYLDGLNETLRAHITAEHDATETFVANVRDDLQGLINGQWSDWDVEFDGFNRTVRTLVQDEQNATEAFVQARYDDRSQFLDGMNGTLRAVVEGEHASTRGDISSFRSHYDARQDDWELSFDGFNQTIRSLVRGEQNATEAFIQARYDQRTGYLDALNSTLRALVSSEHDSTRGLVNAARDSIIADAAGRWGDWNVTFDGFNQTVRTLVVDEHDETRLHIAQGASDLRAYHEAKWDAWDAKFSVYWSGLNTTLTSFEASMDASFNETWSRLDNHGSEASGATDALLAEVRSFWLDYNVTADTDKQEVLERFTEHNVSVQSRFDQVEGVVGTRHQETQDVVAAFRSSWTENHTAWVTHFDTFWADYNATEAANLQAILDRFTALEAANEARFQANLAYILKAWDALGANQSIIEGRVTDFEARLNVTLAQHLAALLAFEESVNASLADQTGIVAALWADVNATAASAGADRQAKYDSVFQAIQERTANLSAELSAHHGQVVANVSALHNATQAEIQAHDAALQALLGANQDEVRQEFADLASLLREDGNETQGLLSAFWGDTNATWDAWYLYYDDVTGGDHAAVIEAVRDEHNQTRTNQSLLHEQYFNKYGLLLQAFSGAIIGGLGEELLTNREEIKAVRAAGFGNSLWSSILVDLAMWIIYGIMGLALLTLVTDRRARALIRSVPGMARLADLRRREAQRRRETARRRRQSPPHQNQADAPPRGAAALPG